jgi:hypothetical protein
MNAIADAIPNGVANDMQLPATTAKIREGVLAGCRDLTPGINL